VANWLTLPLLVSCTFSSSLLRGLRPALLLLGLLANPLLAPPADDSSRAACWLAALALLPVPRSLLLLLLAELNMPGVVRT
jgi:hypothetical protein